VYSDGQVFGGLEEHAVCFFTGRFLRNCATILHGVTSRKISVVKTANRASKSQMTEIIVLTCDVYRALK
jgi:hypothetical protein